MIKLNPVKIGNTTVPHGLFLAPMAGFTDLEFRELCREFGAEYTVTEMISAKAVCFGDKKTAELARMPGQANIGISSPETERKSHENEVHRPLPTALQLFGHDPDDIEQACRLLLGQPEQGIQVLSPQGSTPYNACDGSTDQAKSIRSLPPHACGGPTRPCGVDINMGCPVKKIVTSGDGSALMRDPALCERLTAAAVRGSGDVPVTVKIRAGFDADHKNAVEVALACVRGGATAVAVHGRTREQFYAPSSDNTIIAAVRDALPPSIPVIGNGDIATVEDAERMLRETGCDGIMIGRAALGDPWLFDRIAAAAEGIALPEPTIEERLATALRLCRMVCERYGEARGVPMCRGRAGHFIRGISGAAAMRDRLCHATTFAEVERILAP